MDIMEIWRSAVVVTKIVNRPVLCCVGSRVNQSSSVINTFACTETLIVDSIAAAWFEEADEKLLYSCVLNIVWNNLLLFSVFFLFVKSKLSY